VWCVLVNAGALAFKLKTCRALSNYWKPRKCDAYRHKVR